MGPLLTLFEPLPTPLLTQPLKNYFCRHVGASEKARQSVGLAAQMERHPMSRNTFREGLTEEVSHPFCLLACSVGGRQEAPENATAATHPKTQKTDCSEDLRFRVCCVFQVCFDALLEGNKKSPENAPHPKMQILGMGCLFPWILHLNFACWGDGSCTQSVHIQIVLR